MSIFKKLKEKQTNQEEKENQENQEKPVIEKPKGKFINLTIIKIGIAILVMIIIYNIFSGNNTEVKTEKLKETEVVTANKKQNPYNYSYSDINNKNDTNVVSDVQDISTNQSRQTNQQNQVKNELSQEEREKLRMLEEQAFQAKKSPIAFTINSVKPNNTNNTNDNQNQFLNPNIDYDQNRQNSKKSFLYNEGQTKLYSTNQIVESISPYELKTGDFFPAVVETAMNSDIFSKVIVARVSQNIFDTVTGKYLLIPQGTVLTGVYDSNITWGQDRLLVIWQQLRFPNGDMLRLDNLQGVDMLGQAGLVGKVNNHFATLLKGVLLSSAMGAAAAITTDNNSDNWSGKAGEGAGYSIVQIGDKFASKALEIQPTIIINAGDRFNVMVQSNLILKPYEY